MMSLHVLHHDVGWSHVVNLANVGVIQRRYRARLARKSLCELLVGNFYCDDAIQARISCFINLSHASRAERTDDLVRAKPSPVRQKHGKSLDSTLLRPFFFDKTAPLTAKRSVLVASGHALTDTTMSFSAEVPRYRAARVSKR